MDVCMFVNTDIYLYVPLHERKQLGEVTVLRQREAQFGVVRFQLTRHAVKLLV